MANDRRAIHLNVTVGELVHLKARAARQNQSVSNFIRFKLGYPAATGVALDAFAQEQENERNARLIREAGRRPEDFGF